VVGAPTQIVKITPDEDELAEKGLTDQDIATALDANGLSVPGGTVTDDDRTLDVVVGQRMDSIKDLENIVLIPADDGSTDQSTGTGTEDQTGATGTEDETGTQPGVDPATGTEDTTQAQEPADPVKLGDVAKVKKTTEDATSVSRTNGRESLILMITASADGNVVDISNDAGHVLDDTLSGVGGDADSDVVFDQAPFIRTSIEAVAEEGLLGLVMAIGVILLFLRRVRPTIVTAISIRPRCSSRSSRCWSPGTR
jgi:HAE1 family hydrophobic/amphiphilic exporter-1